MDALATRSYYPRLRDFVAYLQHLPLDLALPYRLIGSADAPATALVHVTFHGQCGRRVIIKSDIPSEDRSWNVVLLVEKGSCAIRDLLATLAPLAVDHGDACVSTTPSIEKRGESHRMLQYPFEVLLGRSYAEYHQTQLNDVADSNEVLQAVIAQKQTDPSVIHALLRSKGWDWSSPLYCVPGQCGPLTYNDIRKAYPRLPGYDLQRICYLSLLAVQVDEEKLYVLKGNHQQLLAAFGPELDPVDAYLATVESKK